MQVLQFTQAVMKTMHSALRRLDLNLLLVFDAVYRHRSVVAAADELAISPSACSHALSRIRHSLADELFIRTGNSMHPTAQAEQIAEGVADALRILTNQLADPEPFAPATSTQTFVFAATDYAVYALLTPLISRLEKMAPALKIKVLYLNRQECLTDLREGRVHFVLDARHDQENKLDGLEVLDCFTDDYVVAVRKGHPRIDTSLSLDQYLGERHIASLPWSDVASVIDTTLARQGLYRDVAVELPSVLAAPYIIATTDFLFTLPRRAVLPFSSAVPLVIYPVPFETPRYTLGLLSNKQYSSSASHRWVREQMLATLSAS
ncbi:LysR family transcriptional regulator [Pseudomonas sp. NA-150]|uniref:LysR family transcriptional regulator n=1 Tax=Pseudomonas sp. NA-150 TaxID=3367525 RepID=UPI0037CB9ABE